MIFVSNSSVRLRISLASARKRAVSVTENVFDCSSAVEERSHQLIYLRAYKNDIETKIQPQQQEYDRCETAVYGEVGKRIDIARIYCREAEPAYRPDYCSGKLAERRGSAGGKECIQHRKERHEQQRSERVPCKCDYPSEFGKEWQIFTQKRRYLSASSFRRLPVYNIHVI